MEIFCDRGDGGVVDEAAETGEHGGEGGSDGDPAFGCLAEGRIDDLIVGNVRSGFLGLFLGCNHI